MTKNFELFKQTGYYKHAVKKKKNQDWSRDQLCPIHYFAIDIRSQLHYFDNNY